MRLWRSDLGLAVQSWGASRHQKKHQNGQEGETDQSDDNRREIRPAVGQFGRVTHVEQEIHQRPGDQGAGQAPAEKEGRIEQAEPSSSLLRRDEYRGKGIGGRDDNTLGAALEETAGIYQAQVGGGCKND